MAALSSDENLPFEVDNLELEQSYVDPENNLEDETDDSGDFNAENEVDDNVPNVDTESELSFKLDYDYCQDDENDSEKCNINDNESQNSADKGSYGVYNDFTKPAGLSSERCVRDFLTAKFRKYHSDKYVVSESVDKRADNCRGYSNTKEVSTAITENDIREIVKSNYLMRRENRMRGMSHVDIFGASEVSNKRRLNLSVEPIYDVNGVAGSNRDSESKSWVNKRMRSNDSMSVNSESNYVMGRDSVTAGAFSDTASVKDDISKVVSLFVIQLSGLKSDACETQLIKICDSCKLHVISVNLDRNILTHSCTGTGTIKVRSSNSELYHLQDLLRENGYTCKVK
ncbi:conserved hypothetical protein [Theileria orientalis strain Shintoku]|uniref:Uncharacterized protein n=1 Tax=Theileria orientalis strain Shintoku TaxID=869250 RepID=J4C8Y4_THEOR|nr:conserved hypothetical protein [Theileria orientalis strain Shintoku]PVC54571.1 hypothetical protein MACL_00002997 [Theileria orientalis]BAM41593.1 conserved hypothetical protein [Theileria orientalis strain Shintoku]|eukprot:XP_009691894.1 conserved hypothetical protein [Theileria orientalis strain Shintoku]